MKQETMGGSGISWTIMQTICISLLITDNQASTPSDALPGAQPTVIEHWRHTCTTNGTWQPSNATHLLYVRVCLSVCPLACLKNRSTRPDFMKFSVHVTHSSRGWHDQLGTAT